MTGTAYTTAHLIDRLQQHRTLGDAPREELAWLVSHGGLVQFGKGDNVTTVANAIDYLYVLFSGHIAIYLDRGGNRRKVMEWVGGDVVGNLPYSRMKFSPGQVYSEEVSEALAIHRRHFPALIRECPEIATILVHVMLDRARVFRADDSQVEKMMSLGKLAAGLAHELNNPASAAARSATLLAGTLAESDEAALVLGAAGLSDAALGRLKRVRELCVGAPAGVQAPLERADREDAIAEWLVARNLDAAAAHALADSAVTLPMLDDMAQVVQGSALDAAVRWIASGCATRGLVSDIEKAASRVYTLVSAVKGFTHMDRPSTPELLDVGRGLADTIAVLGSKARQKSVGVRLELEPDLPRVMGSGGELNQVWANLIDNAIDAVPASGQVTVTAQPERGWVVVRVIDNGPGIPDDISGRIFDPFFTTKPVGQGTGLGLDIVRRQVQQHGGSVELETRPGRTEFRVSLPLPDEEGAGERA